MEINITYCTTDRGQSKIDSMKRESAAAQQPTPAQHPQGWPPHQSSFESLPGLPSIGDHVLVQIGEQFAALQVAARTWAAHQDGMHVELMLDWNSDA